MARFNYLIKVVNDSKSNLRYVYNQQLIKEIQYLFELFNNHKEININFLNTHKEVQSIIGQPVASWVRGFCNYDDVYILEYSKEFYTNIDEFYGILIHEVIHALVYRKIKNCPLWLNEGLALVLSKQFKFINFEQFSNIEFNELSYNDDFFYEKCCSKTMRYFNKYSDKKLIEALIEKKIQF